MSMFTLSRRLQRSILSLSVIASFLLAGFASAAPAVGPDEMVKNVTSEVLTYLEANTEQLTNNPDEVVAVVRNKVLPHFDFRYMSQLVLGKHWRRASDSQKNRFTEAFKGLLISTYSNSLTEYSGQEVEYLPFRAADDAEKVTVKIEVIPQAGLPIPIDYQLHVSDDAWKVYDVNIDGLSIISNYRSSVGQEVANKGLDKVIADMEAKRAQ